MQLSFYYSDNLVDLRQKFITVESGVEQLFNELLDLPSSRQLDVEVGSTAVWQCYPCFVETSIHITL